MSMQPLRHALPTLPPPALRGAAMPGIVVAIPARDAATEIGGCLMALAAQRNALGLRLAPGAFGVLLLVHDSRDHTANLARALAPRLPFPLLVQDAAQAGIDPASPARLSAPWAWRSAVELAAEWLDRGNRPDGVILTTSPAARPGTGWVAANLAAIAEGADAVAGRLLPRQPAAVSGAGESYALLLQALAARLDPEPLDPWPRHACEDSASLAVTLHALDRLSGLPLGPGGEAVALLAALRRQDGRIRHAPEVVVQAPAYPAPLPEALPQALRRLRARAALRQLWGDGIGTVRPETPAFQHWASRLGLPPGELGRLLATTAFGAAWAAVEAASPSLVHRPLAPRLHPAASLAARLVLAALRPVRIMGKRQHLAA